ncbi:MAG: hypothetical protein U1E33_01750 [Rhodospirillales bacterium]
MLASAPLAAARHRALVVGTTGLAYKYRAALSAAAGRSRSSSPPT